MQYTDLTQGKKPRRQPTYPIPKATEEYSEEAEQGETNNSCPIETSDVQANLANRQKAITEANYGPLNPSEPNTEYWQAAAERWRVSLEQVQTARCMHCAAFNVTTQMQECIAKGIGTGEMDVTDLGFCETFDFKCSASRRCDAWITGGPITDDLAKSFDPSEIDDTDIDEQEAWHDEELHIEFMKNRDTMYVKIAAPAWMQDNAKRGLEWHKQGKSGDGVTEQTINEARAMAGGNVSDDKAMRMAAWFARHMGDLDAPAATVGADGYPSAGIVAHALWGGGSRTQSERAAAWARGQADKPNKAVSAAVSAGLQKKVDEHNEKYGDNKAKRVTLGMLSKVFQRGIGAYQTNPSSVRPTVTSPEQWAYARVNAFLFAVRTGRYKGGKFDTDLLPESHDLATSKTMEITTENTNVQLSGGEVKALGNGKLGGYLVRYTNESEPDLQGDYFTNESELGSFETLPVLYHHGTDNTIGKRIIGNGTIRKDEIGLWVEAQLAMRDEYEKQIYALAEKGKLGWSSGAVSHMVEREYKSDKVAWVKTWWIAEASLTPTPAEARNEAITTKGLDNAQPEEAQPASDDAVITEGEVLETTQEQITMEANDVTELKAQIAALTAIVNEPKVEAGKMAPVLKDLGGDHDGGMAFKHWVRTGQMNYYTKNNEQDWSATKTNILNETTGTEGGILVPEGLYATIIEKRDEASIVRVNGALVIQTNLDKVQVPVENAKVTAAIIAESGSYVAAEPTFTSNNISVFKFGNQIRLTDELLADNATNLMPYLSNSLGRAFGLLENAFMIAGTGSSQPKGLLVGGTSAITAASATAITAAELVSLYHALPEAYTTNPSEVVFMTRNATLGALRALASSSVFTFNLQPQGDQAAGSLYGHKVAVSGSMQAATTGNKSLLVTNLAAGYVIVERAGMVMQRNPYLLQATGEVAMFSTMRFGASTTVAEATQILTQA